MIIDNEVMAICSSMAGTWPGKLSQFAIEAMAIE
jgi:hypothetical protein